MFKKKFVALAITVELMITTMSSTVFATVDSFPIEYGMPIEITESEILTERAIEEKLKAIEEDFNRNRLPKLDHKRVEKEIEKAQKLLNRANDLKNGVKNESEQTLAVATSYYDTNKAKLRQANYIETILDFDEGLSETNVYKIGVTHANTARDAALKAYPNDVMMADAFRHFAWNYIAAKDLGAYKTRTATINHEWGFLLLDPVTNYYTNKYNEYTKNGDSDYTASKKRLPMPPYIYLI